VTSVKPVRAFVALELPVETRTRIGTLVTDLRPEIAKIRWLPAEGIHLTLRFLGETPPEILRQLEPDLRRAAGSCPRAEACVSGLGLFPERGGPRILWLGVALPATVLTLQAACEAAAIRNGFPPERRPFRPHLTLGRWREHTPRPTLPPVDLGLATLDTLTLFQSELGPEGARYTRLATFSLG